MSRHCRELAREFLRKARRLRAVEAHERKQREVERLGDDGALRLATRRQREELRSLARAGFDVSSARSPHVKRGRGR